MRERVAFEQEIARLGWATGRPALERETDAELRRATRHLSLLPHRGVQNGKDVLLTPAVADPGIYDGATKYKIAPTLQKCLATVMAQRKFAHIRVAIADLTKDVNAPEFAGVKHQEQVFVASVAKIAVMLAAFQLRHDLNIAAAQMASGTVDDLFRKVRGSWAATQKDPGGAPTAFAGTIQRRGALVLSGGAKLGFSVTLKNSGKSIEVPKSPRLELVLDPVSQGSRFGLAFNSSNPALNALMTLVKQFNLTEEQEALQKGRRDLSEANRTLNRARTVVERSSARARQKEATRALGKAQAALKDAKKKQPDAGGKIRALGFLERLGISAGGAVPASNLATSTVVADAGFHYIASTLLQTGLFDPGRGGGLWLGADYVNTIWRSAPGGGTPQSATAGSLVAFMTLLAQGRLVSSAASEHMAKMMKKPADFFVATGSYFRDGLSSRPLKRVISKVGLKDGADEAALIERDVDAEVEDDRGVKTRKKVTLRYAVAALRAKNPRELEALIRELDDCILANNGLPKPASMRL